MEEYGFCQVGSAGLATSRHSRPKKPELAGEAGFLTLSSAAVVAFVNLFIVRMQAFLKTGKLGPGEQAKRPSTSKGKEGAAPRKRATPWVEK